MDIVHASDWTGTEDGYREPADPLDPAEYAGLCSPIQTYYWVPSRKRTDPQPPAEKGAS